MLRRAFLATAAAATLPTLEQAAASAPLPLRGLAQSTESVTAYIARRGAAAVAADLTTLASSHAGWRFFNLRWQWPDQIAGAWHRAGVTTVGEAVAWAERMAIGLSHTDVQQLEIEFGVLPAGIDLSSMPAASVEAIHVQYIAAQANATNGVCGLSPDSQAWPNGDTSYRLAPAQHWVALLQAYPGALRPFQPLYNDCEKSVDNFKGWLCDMRLGQLACAKAWLDMYSGVQKAAAGHVAAIVVTGAGNAMFVEPQERALLPLTHTQFRGYRGDFESGFFKATATRIARLLI